MPIPTGTASISFSQIRTEMNGGSGGDFPSAATPTAPQGTAMSLNNAAFRSRLTDTAQNAQLSLSAIRGNAYQRFIIAADTTNYDIRTAFGAAPIGWNTTSKASADVVVNSGIVVGTGSTGSYAMDTGGPWPTPSTIVVYNNGGYVVGMGGAGGNGGPAGGNGGAGTAGGPALRAQRNMTLNNYNGGIVGGGGGGGGGGDGKSHTAFLFGSNVPFNNGGGGGGGGRTGRTNSAGGGPGPASGGNPDPGSAGQAGTFAAAGNGGNGGTSPQPAGDGGPGGSWGVAGTVGGQSGGAGGAAGISVQGWSLVSSVNGTTGISGPTSG